MEYEENKVECTSVSKFIQIINRLPDNNRKLLKELFSKNYKENIVNESKITNMDYKDRIILNETYLKRKVENISERNRDSKSVRYFYRGHSKVSYSLIPSVFRYPNDIHGEEYYYHNIKIECPSMFDNTNRIGQLVKMQHYDCPTRLLDITSNPLVALFFACQDNQDEDGVVFVFFSNYDNVLYSDSDKALMLACLAKFKEKDKEQMTTECLSKMRCGKNIVAPLSNVMSKFEHEVKTENPSFVADIDPFDLMESYYLQPEKNNNRILKQDGAFIISGLSANKAELEDKLNTMVYMKIIIKNKSKIMKELDRLGINEATLFPEVDRVAHYLKDKKY